MAAVCFILMYFYLMQVNTTTLIRVVQNIKILLNGTNNNSVVNSVKTLEH